MQAVKENNNYMKSGRLRKVVGFWKSLFFMGNVYKIRKSLMSYLKEEGLNCEIKDGEILIEFNESYFSSSIGENEDYTECTIMYQCTDEDYAKLDIKEKTFMADKVNTDLENHATVYAYDDSFYITTSFYFTSKQMLLNLFVSHFDELVDSLNEANDILCSKIKEHKNEQTRRIGFYVNSDQQYESQPNEVQVAAKL